MYCPICKKGITSKDFVLSYGRAVYPLLLFAYHDECTKVKNFRVVDPKTEKIKNYTFLILMIILFGYVLIKAPWNNPTLFNLTNLILFVPFTLVVYAHISNLILINKLKSLS